MIITILRMLLVNLFTSSCPLLDLILKYIGINVVPKAALIPSNKTTGILRAVRYASVISPAPNVCANTISLKNPVILEVNIININTRAVVLVFFDITIPLF